MKEKERNTTEDVNHYDNPEYQFLIDDPQIKTSIDINTQFRDLCSISCLSDENVWVSECNESTIKLVNFQGELVKSIPTKTRNMPWDIAVTKSGDLVYTDYADHTVNIVKGKNIEVQELIRLQQWKPVSVFFPSSGDLLLIMDSDDNSKQNYCVTQIIKKTRVFNSMKKVSLSIHPIVMLNTSLRTEIKIYVYQIVQLIQLWLSVNLDLCVLYILRMAILQRSKFFTHTVLLQTARVGF